jgi:hypothetical protein
VGFNVAGYEFALDPNSDTSAGPTTYWGVADIDDAVAQLTERGAALRTAVTDVGDQIRVATLDLPAVGVVGLIENPHFQAGPTTGAGPGR